MSGRLIAVVGPSGVGKDSLIRALTEARPGLHWVRRVITRPADPEGEAHHPATDAEFARMQADGAFCLDWQAHELRYGIPASALERAQSGTDQIVNLSRTVLSKADQVFAHLTVLSVTASPQVLAARLGTRGRETPEAIAARLARSANLPAGLTCIPIVNDGPLADCVAQALAALTQQEEI